MSDGIAVAKLGAPMRTLRALIISDERPGHYHLAEGVAAAISRRRPVQITRLSVARRRWIPGRVAAALARSAASPSMVLRLVYGIDAAALPASDAVMSAGGDTLVANAATARILGATNIFCGSLRHLPPEQFSLIVSSYARHQALPRHLVMLKPNPMDPDRFREEHGGKIPDAKDRNRPPRLAGMCIGGDSGLFHYQRDEWDKLLAFVRQSHAELGTRWIVSTSRRTPADVADAVAALARSAPDAVEEMIDVRSTGHGTLPRLLGRVDAVLVTEDSSSMISEAVTARIPVVGVSPQHHAFNENESEYRTLLKQKGWCRYLPISALTPATFLRAMAETTPLTANHLDLLADELASHLPRLFAAND